MKNIHFMSFISVFSEMFSLEFTFFCLGFSFLYFFKCISYLWTWNEWIVISNFSFSHSLLLKMPQLAQATTENYIFPYKQASLGEKKFFLNIWKKKLFWFNRLKILNNEMLWLFRKLWNVFCLFILFCFWMLSCFNPSRQLEHSAAHSLAQVWMAERIGRVNVRKKPHGLR